MRKLVLVALIFVVSNMAMAKIQKSHHYYEFEDGNLEIKVTARFQHEILSSLEIVLEDDGSTSNPERTIVFKQTVGSEEWELNFTETLSSGNQNIIKVENRVEEKNIKGKIVKVMEEEANYSLFVMGALFQDPPKKTTLKAERLRQVLNIIVAFHTIAPNVSQKKWEAFMGTISSLASEAVETPHKDLVF